MITTTKSGKSLFNYHSLPGIVVPSTPKGPWEVAEVASLRLSALKAKSRGKVRGSHLKPGLEIGHQMVAHYPFKHFQHGHGHWIGLRENLRPGVDDES